MMFAAGVLLGLVGSGHCVGMCGPLVLSIGPRLEPPLRSTPRMKNLLFYHAGRVSTYLLIALPAGVAGQLLSLRGLSRAAAVIGAVILLGMALGIRRVPGASRLHGVSTSVAARGCASAARLARRRPLIAPVAFGAANGLVPCGLVYAAAAAAAASASLPDALFMMAGFGLGTTPALIALSWSAAAMPLRVRMRIQRLTPAVLVLAAVLLLARAFDLPRHAGPAHAGHPQAVILLVATLKVVA